MNDTNWIPGLVVLALGIVTAAIFLLTSRGSKAAKASGKGAKAEELDARARQLIEALKELEQNKHQLSAEQLAKERSKLEKEAAAALRARDEHLGRKAGEPIAAPGSASAPSPSPAAQGGFFAKHPELKGAIWGAAVVLFFGGVGLWLYENQKPKEGTEQPMPAPPMDPEETELEGAIQRLNANPQDTGLAAMVGHELIRLERWEEASEVTERSLGVDPFQVENRIHRALLRAPRGDIQGAMKELTQLANAYPKAYEALLFLGSLAMNQGDHKTALSAFERYAAEAPADEQPPQLAQAIQELRAGGHP